MVYCSGSKSRASSEFLCFSSFTIGFDLRWLRGRSSPALRELLSSGRPQQKRWYLVSVGVSLRAGRGGVDPVHDDEAHAADHDHETAQQEGGSPDLLHRLHGLLLDQFDVESGG